MKKKFTLTLLSFVGAFSLISLSACHRSDNSGKVYLDYGYIRENPISNITDLKELKYSEVKAKVESKENFMLVLYNSSCSCWADFQPVITQYINDTNIKVEYIDVDEFAGESDKFGLYLEKINMPSVAVFKRGKLVRQPYLNSSDPSYRMFKEYSYFKAWSDENIVMPKMYYIEKETLDSYISSNKSFTLYIGRSECGDCQKVNYDVLYNFSDSHVELREKLYIFDIQQYRSDMDYYQEIKDMYGLTTVNNPKFGYDLYGGVVPTFQRRNGSTIVDMISIRNDLAIENKVSSYFTTERVEHMEFLKNSSLTAVLNDMNLTDEQMANWRSSYSEKFYKEYHYPILNLFLNSYLN